MISLKKSRIDSNVLFPKIVKCIFVLLPVLDFAVLNKTLLGAQPSPNTDKIILRNCPSKRAV